MRKFTGFILAIMIFTSIELFAVKITATADAGPSSAEQINLNAFVNDLYATDLGALGHQKKLARGMGNAVAHAGNSVASFRGYEGYDIFAGMWGLSFAVVIPPVSDAADDLMAKEKDDAAGIALNQAFNVGINLTNALDINNLLGLDFLPNRLYMNIKGSKTSAKGGTFNDADDWKFKMTTFGLGFNYQLVDTGGDRFKVYKWTGMSIGTGFLYARNKITYDHTSGIYKNSAGDRSFKIDTQYGVDIKTYTIPLEASTSARLLWLFNFTAGAGIDFTFGTSKIIKESNSNVYTGISASGAKVGTIYVDGSSKNSPTYINPKILGGLGVCLGPIPVDISITYYPVSNGIVFCTGFGFVW